MQVVKSFEELGKVFGIKSRNRKNNGSYKCPKCGKWCKVMPGTNVAMCNNVQFREDSLKDGTKVTVFKPCNEVFYV